MFHVGIWLSYISAVREGFRLFGSSLTSTPSSFLPSCPPTIHPVPRSWGMQWNLLHCRGWRRREWGFGGRLVQTRDKRASDAPFLLWTMHYALCVFFPAEKVCTVPWMQCTSCDIGVRHENYARMYRENKDWAALGTFSFFIQMIGRTSYFSCWTKVLKY